MPNETQVVYVSPLKALSNDVQKNLEVPLAEIAALAAQRRHPARADPHRGAHRRYAGLRSAQQMGKQPPHILVTTPESLLHSADRGDARARCCAPRAP